MYCGSYRSARTLAVLLLRPLAAVSFASLLPSPVARAAAAKAAPAKAAAAPKKAAAPKAAAKPTATKGKALAAAKANKRGVNQKREVKVSDPHLTRQHASFTASFTEQIHRRIAGTVFDGSVCWCGSGGDTDAACELLRTAVFFRGLYCSIHAHLLVRR